MTLQQQKVMRVNVLLASIVKVSEAGSSVNKERLISECAMRWGMARRTVLEYLSVLKGSHKILIVGSEIKATTKGTKDEARREANQILQDYLPKEEPTQNGN